MTDDNTLDDNTSVLFKELVIKVVEYNAVNRDIHNVEKIVRYLPSWDGIYDPETQGVELTYVNAPFDYLISLGLFLKGAKYVKSLPEAKGVIISVPASMNGTLSKDILNAHKKKYVDTIRQYTSKEEELDYLCNLRISDAERMFDSLSKDTEEFMIEEFMIEEFKPEDFKAKDLLKD